MRALSGFSISDITRLQTASDTIVANSRATADNVKMLLDDLSRLPGVGGRAQAGKAQVEKQESVFQDLSVDGLVQLSETAKQQSALVLEIERTVLGPTGVTIGLGLAAGLVAFGWWLRGR